MQFLPDLSTHQRAERRLLHPPVSTFSANASDAFPTVESMDELSAADRYIERRIGHSFISLCFRCSRVTRQYLYYLCPFCHNEHKHQRNAVPRSLAYGVAMERTMLCDGGQYVTLYVTPKTKQSK